MLDCCNCNAFMLGIGCTIPSTDLEWACPNNWGDDCPLTEIETEDEKHAGNE